MNLSTRIEVSRPVKVGLVLGCLILIWLMYNSGDHDSTVHPVISDTGAHDQAAVETPVTSTPEPRLRVDVYYECLCPDSRYFVLHHLQPTVAKLGSMMDVRMWPYGKAHSKQEGKDYSFDCQHGPPECEGNIYHACVTKYVQDQDKQIEMLSCMINDNMQPGEIFRSCAAKLDIDKDRIEFCATTPEGRKLHYTAGTKTDKLSPPVSFIPTIEIDASQHSQKAILKNFKGEVCRIYAEKYLQPGQKIANCSESKIKVMSENSNLVQELEESFQKCLTALTEEDDLYSRDPDDINKDIEEKMSQFTDVARQLETFFLQKRFMIYNHKPEMILKEDTGELKLELSRKDELIRKHYDKLSKWKEMLAEAQVNPPVSSAASGNVSRAQAPVSGPGGHMPGPGGQTPHGSFVPGNNYPRMPGQQHNMFGTQQNLQGPLAYLERTTSNIGGGPGSMGSMMNR